MERPMIDLKSTKRLIIVILIGISIGIDSIVVVCTTINELSQQQQKSQQGRQDLNLTEINSYFTNWHPMQLGGKCAIKSSCKQQQPNRRLSEPDNGGDKLSCYCDQKCVIYDDCCYDSDLAKPIAERFELGQKNKLKVLRNEWHCKRINRAFGDILVKASCNQEWINRRVRSGDKQVASLVQKRCEYAKHKELNSQNNNANQTIEEDPDWLQSDPIGSLMPITDLNSGITYANSYCLRCNTLGSSSVIFKRRKQQQNNETTTTNRINKLIYWSPLLECNYNMENDDRNTLYDLINTKKGQVLRYCTRRRQWVINVPDRDNNNMDLGSMHDMSTTEIYLNNNVTKSNGRACSIMPTIPESIEHLVRYCRSQTIDTCLMDEKATTGMTTNDRTVDEQEQLRRAKFECQYGHQSLVYGQMSDQVYYNLGCAKCNHERQVFCEPKLRKRPNQSDSPPRITYYSTSSQQQQQQQQQQQPSGSIDHNIPELELGGDLDSDSETGRSVYDIDPQQQRKLLTASFSVLMDIGGQGGSQVGSTHQCSDPHTQVYDPFFLTCRDIVCGLNHYFEDGRCMSANEPNEHENNNNNNNNDNQDQNYNLNLHPLAVNSTTIDHLNGSMHRTTAAPTAEALLATSSATAVQNIVVGTSSPASESTDKPFVGTRMTTRSQSNGGGGEHATSELSNRPTLSPSSSILQSSSAGQLVASNESLAKQVASTNGAAAPAGSSSRMVHQTNLEASLLNLSESSVAALQAGGLNESERKQIDSMSTKLELPFNSSNESRFGDQELGHRVGQSLQTPPSVPNQQAKNDSIQLNNGSNNIFSLPLEFADQNPLELPLPTPESRRLFTKCGKIHIQNDHYRLFSLSLSQFSQLKGYNHSNQMRYSSSSSLSKSNHSTNRRSNDFKLIWAFIIPYNLTLSSSQFELVRARRDIISSSSSSLLSDTNNNFELLICSPFSNDLVDKFNPAMAYLTTICLFVSIASLTLYLLLYCLSTFDLHGLVVEMKQSGKSTKDILGDPNNTRYRDSRMGSEASHMTTRSQSLSSRGVACLSAALLAAYLLFIMGHHQQQQQQQQHYQIKSDSEPLIGVSQQPAGWITWPSSCALIAVGTYFCFLIAFNWMFLLSYDIWRTLRLATCQLRAPALHSQSTRFIVYSLLAFMVAALIASLALVTEQAHIVSCQNQNHPFSSEMGGLTQATQINPNAGSNCTAFDTNIGQFIKTYRPKFGHRSGSCWFSNRRALALFFGLPVTLVMIINLLFFLHSSYMVIKTSSRSSRRLTSSSIATPPNITTQIVTTSIHNNNDKSPKFSFTTVPETTIATTTTSLASDSTTSDSVTRQESLINDFTIQNCLTTTSITSVQTVRSNLSAQSSCCTSFDDGDSCNGDSPTTSLAATQQQEQQQSEQEQQQANPQPITETNENQSQDGARLAEAAHNVVAQAAVRAAEYKRKLESKKSSSSLGGVSTQTSSSRKCESHISCSNLQYLSSFMSSIVKDYRLYCRLSTIMGLTWLTGLVASIVDQSEALWYLFVILNTLQGLFIFIAFGCKRSKLANLEIILSYLQFRAKRWYTKKVQHEQKQNAAAASAAPQDEKNQLPFKKDNAF